MAPTLLVLAAGMGSRYGGLKQMDPVGPSGETVLDYAVFDAVRAGFGRVVFVIRREFEEAFKSVVTAKYSGRIAVGFVYQSPADLPAGFEMPEGRGKPWGTGHAVWCARGSIDGPFAVINADDFYGATAYARLSAFLDGASGTRFALVGFKLGKTLSENGAVSRGICRESEGRLVSIVEEREIVRASVGPGCRFSGDEVVSMNFWGFTPSLFAGLEAGLVAFLNQRAGEAGSEFYLPTAVSDLVSGERATVDVLSSDDTWFGVTYREDKTHVAAAIAALVRSGAYPARLFG
jgi:NDP-sugar pyrophosphorylase family protein